MRNIDDRDELDDMIDGALRGYARAEPMEGIEERVLRRVRAAGARRSSPWAGRWWMAAPALAAVLVVCVGLRTWWKPPALTSRTTPDYGAPRLTTPVQPSPAPPATKERPRGEKVHKRIVAVRVLPKEECFPAPTPLTAEERALAAWASREPEEARQALEDLKQRAGEPVTIQAILIPPLQIDGAE